MGNTFVAFLLAVGVGGWVYSKTLRATGNNTQSALVAAGATAVLAFVVMWILLGFIPEN